MCGKQTSRDDHIWAIYSLYVFSAKILVFLTLLQGNRLLYILEQIVKQIHGRFCLMPLWDLIFGTRNIEVRRCHVILVPGPLNSIHSIQTQPPSKRDTRFCVLAQLGSFLHLFLALLQL